MKKTVLIIEDDEGIMDAVSLTLQDEGYTVFTSHKGIDVQKQVLECKPSIVILDVLMSGTDGREISKMLKGSPATKEIPILMMSAHPKATEAAEEVGVEGYLSKPFDAATLIEKVSELIMINDK